MRKQGKRAVAWMLAAAMVLGGLPLQELRAKEAEPRAQKIFIDSARELVEFANTVNGGDSFQGREAVLTGDLNMEGVEMEAIGTEGVPFRGTFEGQGYEIQNLSIDGADNQGLFGVVRGGIVQDVTLTQARIVGERNTGGIAGSSSGTIKNCIFQGEVQGMESVGGIVGVQTGGTITRCASQAEVSGTGNDTGGVLGKGNGGQTELCSSQGNVTGGMGTCGGVAGYLNGSSVANCYSRADVSTTGANIGGIIGGIDGNSPAKCCYSTGAVTNNGTGNGGGAIGWNRAGDVSGCYYNSDVYKGTAIGSNESGGTAYGKSTEELKLEETFEGFDFTSVWTFAEGVNDGYPVFLPEKPADERVNADYEWLTFDQIKGENESQEKIGENLQLPVKGLYDSNIYWSSSNPEILLNSGVLVSGLTQKTQVTLTARVTAEGLEKEKEFTVTVLPTQKEERPLHILQIGDSNTEFARITQSMNQILKNEYGMYGDGFLTLCKDYINIAPEHFSIEYDGQWYQYDLVYGAGEFAAAQDTPFGLYAQSRSAGDTITVQFAGSAVDLYYLSWAGAGTFRVTIDGVDYGQVVQTSNEFVTKKAVYEGLSYGLHTMVIENVSGIINFYGADYRVDQAESRKNISTWGKAGIQAKQYAVDLNEAVFETALTQLNPDVVVLLLGTNDNGWAACPADTLEGYLDTIIKRVKEALPQTEIWVLSTFETVNSKEILHSYWDSAFPNAARKNGVHYWSMGEWFGPYTTKQMADGWHSNLQASQKIAEKLYQVILGGQDVVGRNVVSVQQPDGVNAKTGTFFENLKLPERVKVQLDDLQQSDVWADVQWSPEGYSEGAGSYTLKGSLVLPEEERIYNPQNLQVSLCVTLREDYRETQDLRLFYDFEDVEDGMVPDLAGGGYTGKLCGNVEIGEAMTGSGAVLPGDSGSYLEIPKEALLDCEEMTLSMWVKLDQAADWTTLFSVGSETTNYVVMAGAGSPGGVPCGVTTAIMADGGAEYRIKAPAEKKVPVGKWVQIVYTQAYGKAHIYLDGELVAQEEDMPVSFEDVIAAGADQIRLGAANAWPDPAVKGTVEEVKIYGQALTQEEILDSIREKEEGADKSSLQLLYDLYKDRSESDYTPESWEVFVEAFNRAEEVLADETVSQQEVDEASQALKDAAEALVSVGESGLTEEDLKEAVEAAEAAKDAAEKAEGLAQEAKKEAERLAGEAAEAQKKAEEAWQKAKEMADASETEKEAAIAQAEEAASQAQEARKRAEEAQYALERAEAARDAARKAVERCQAEAEAIRSLLQAAKDEIDRTIAEAEKSKEEAERLKKEAEESAKLAEEALKKLQQSSQEQKPENIVRKGEIYTVGKLKYRVTDTKKNTVSVTGVKKKGQKTVTIPATVKIRGESYKVTAVSKKAFRKNSSVRKVILGKHVTEIGKNAFEKARNLKSVVLRTNNLKKVGKGAFQGVDKRCVIRVPSGKAKAYRKVFGKSGMGKVIKIK